eukprot:EG_transcript_2760
MFNDDKETQIPIPNDLATNGDQIQGYCTTQTAAACKGSALFEEVQRSHFLAFFTKQHRIRSSLPSDANLPAMMCLIADGLHKMTSSAPWLRLQLHLKVRNTLRKRARRLVLLRTQRIETLDSWLTFWCAAEARIQTSFRQQLQHSISLQEVLRGPRATIARAVTPVADALKVQVIWELYWILRSQYMHRLKVHWRRLLALMGQRRTLIHHQRPTRAPAYASDFWQGEPVSLRAVNAAIFLQLLQEPKFQYTAGRDIKVTELLRFANANLAKNSWVEAVESPLGPQGCPTLLAFLSSPLLTESQWLKSRSKQTNTFIPPCTWGPPLRGQLGTPPSGGELSGPQDVVGQSRLPAGSAVLMVRCNSLLRPDPARLSLTAPHRLQPLSARDTVSPERTFSPRLPGAGDDLGQRCRSTMVGPHCGTLSASHSASPPRRRKASPRMLSGSPKARSLLSFRKLFRRTPTDTEVTTIYPRLPAAVVLKEPAYSLSRQSPRSLNGNPPPSSAPSPAFSTSLPTILPRRC